MQKALQPISLYVFTVANLNKKNKTHKFFKYYLTISIFFTFLSLVSTL